MWISETVFKVVNEEHDKLEAKKKTKHQNSISGRLEAFNLGSFLHSIQETASIAILHWETANNCCEFDDVSPLLTVCFLSLP